MMRGLEDELLDLDASDLRRRIRWVGSEQGREVLLDGDSVLNFASNDYLGLANHPDVIGAMQDALGVWGVGSGSSRLITGSMRPHGDLEDYIAELKGCEAALSMSTGYATAVSTLGGLLGKGDTVILDKLVHASLIDGARLSGATVRVFPHNGLAKLERLLEASTGSAGRVLVVTESVFSMDGDVALLDEIVSLKNRFGALLLVDEAHGMGVFGGRGLGLIEELGMGGDGGVDIHMGTLGKSAGVAGGYVAGARVLMDLIMNKGRAFIYSTAPPPAQAVAARRALEIITSDEGVKLRERLWGNIRSFSEMVSDVKVIEPVSAIIPWMVGGEGGAVELSDRLLAEGIFVPAIRYPTVSRGSARLRITMTAAHGEDDLVRLAEVLRGACGKTTL